METIALPHHGTVAEKGLSSCHRRHDARDCCGIEIWQRHDNNRRLVYVHYIRMGYN